MIQVCCSILVMSLLAFATNTKKDNLFGKYSETSLELVNFGYKKEYFCLINYFEAFQVISCLNMLNIGY